MHRLRSSVLVCVGLFTLLRADEPGIKTIGAVTLFHLNVALPVAKPVHDLRAINFKQFTYVLYPIAAVGSTEPLSGDRPLMIRVADGVYDHRADQVPLEFDISTAELVQLPRAPGGTAAIVYGILYSGGDAEQCTGVVQILELTGGKLMLTDQITYNCKGGATAKFDSRKRQLIVESAHFAAGDRPCCPSLSDRVRFKLDGERVKGEQVAE